jgi:hypothetical protein
MKTSISRLKVLFVILALLALTGSVTAQAQDVTEALELSGRPIVLETSLSIPGPPTVEPLADGRVLFKINAEGPVSGDLEGVIRLSVTQTNLASSMEAMSAMFTIETDQGTLEGYYVGVVYPGEHGGTIRGIGHGQILSVSRVYADLFLADVYDMGQVQLGEDGIALGSSSTMTITARR